LRTPGATTAKTEILGECGAATGEADEGFLAHVSGTRIVAESHEAVNYPHEPQQRVAKDVNDACQIVGVYTDSSGVDHGYERSNGKFSTIDVPFAGATAALADGINNSGGIVGGWFDSSGAHAFTLIGGAYA